MDSEIAGQPLTTIAIAVGVLVLGIGLAAVIRRLVVRSFEGSDSSPGAYLLVARFVQLLIVAGSILYALTTLGIRVSPLLGALGIGGIAVALAVQSVLSNAIASVILQVRRPFQVGDQIATNHLEGRVLDVNLRTVRLLTFDGNDVVVPASKVLDEPITNYTRRTGRRSDLAVGVAYDTDLDQARRVLIAAAAAVEGVHETPEPEAWVLEFGDNAITITLRWWHDSTNAVLWRVRSEVAVGVKRAFDSEGLVIAFPQRVLHLAPGSVDLVRESREPAGGQ